MDMRQNRITKFAGLLVLFAGLVAALSGCQSDPTTFGSPRGDNAGAEGGTNGALKTNPPLQFKPGDSIKVVFSDTDLQPIETEIKHDGTISLPLVQDAFKAAGKTPRETEVGIHALYVPRLYRQLTVTVTPGARFFYVGGQVKQEGRIQYAGRITVLKAIQAAGGMTNFADKKRVQLTKSNGQVIIIDWNKAIKDPSLDVEIYPGDQINVPEGIL
jgi:polysaccharide biosynthesis/export protein